MRTTGDGVPLVAGSGDGCAGPVSPQRVGFLWGGLAIGVAATAFHASCDGGGCDLISTLWMDIGRA